MSHLLVGEFYVSPKGEDFFLPRGYVLSESVGSEGLGLYSYDRKWEFLTIAKMSLDILWTFFWEEFRTQVLALTEEKVLESNLASKTQDLVTLFTHVLQFEDYAGLVWFRDDRDYVVGEVSQTGGLNELGRGNFPDSRTLFLDRAKRFIDWLKVQVR